MMKRVGFIFLLMAAIVMAGCVVSGNVSKNGEGVQGVMLELKNAKGTFTAVTDSKGDYKFSSLKILPGDYTLTPLTTGYVYDPASFDVKVDFDPASATGFNFEIQLDPGVYDWGYLKDLWKDAPALDGVYPYSDGGPTATCYIDCYDKLLIIKDDKYWYLEKDGVTWMPLDDPAWPGYGYLSSAWSSAPEVDGEKPLNGITSLYYDNGNVWVIKGDKYWIVNAMTAVWSASGKLADVLQDAPEIDGVKPFMNGGPTASTYINSWNMGLIMMGDRYWYINATGWVGPDGPPFPGYGYVQEYWKDFPSVGGSMPTEGVTALYYTYYDNILGIICGEKYWLYKADPLE